MGFKWLEEAENMSDETVSRVTPNTPVGESERVVGEVPLPLRKLYAFAVVTGEKKHALFGSGDLRSYRRASGMVDPLLNLFWALLFEELNLWEVEKLGIRKDWQVVVISLCGCSACKVRRAVEAGIVGLSVC